MRLHATWWAVVALVLTLAGVAQAIEFTRIGDVDGDVGYAVVTVDRSSTGKVIMCIHNEDERSIIVFSLANARGIAGLLETAFASGRHLGPDDVKELYRKSPDNNSTLTVGVFPRHDRLWLCMSIEDDQKQTIFFSSPQKAQRLANLLRKAAR